MRSSIGISVLAFLVAACDTPPKTVHPANARRLPMVHVAAHGCDKTAPPGPVGMPTSLAHRWLSAGLSNFWARNDICALAELSHATADFRQTLHQEPWTGPFYLSFSLSQEGATLAKLGRRRQAAEKWRQAADVLSAAQLIGQNPTQHADELFARHEYKAAFRAYQKVIFFWPNSSVLTNGEYEDGAAYALQKALPLAVKGNYPAALRVLQSAGPSEAARFLEGQLASVTGNYKLAYDAYVDEVLSYKPLGGNIGPYGTVFDRPTWRRLVGLTTVGNR